jgi:hypothetical protein
MKRNMLILTGGTAIMLLLTACGGTTVTPPVPDMVPLGDGIKVLAYAVIAAAVVVTLGKLLP